MSAPNPTARAIAEWNGDWIRDDYEIALLRAFMALRKPV
jgi:hypothetical protein